MYYVLTNFFLVMLIWVEKYFKLLKYNIEIISKYQLKHEYKTH